MMSQKKTILITGFVGLLASVLVGVGEFMLHFDPMARYGDGFAFLQSVPRGQATMGHFIGVLGAPLYVVGGYHIYLMLRPANEIAARITGLIMAYGFCVGAVWIGSRSVVNELVMLGSDPDQLALYTHRFESLLTVVRLAILVMSGLFIWLCLTGRTYYPRYMAVLNPIFLILVAFAIFFVAPSAGKYIMPIALNAAFFIIFTVSLIITYAKVPE
jgi:hypothetical protein